MVLAHHLIRANILWRLACYLSLFSAIHCGFAQVLANGQIHTGGLSIINSPQPNTPIHAGSNLAISVDISGNGRMPPPTLMPGSSSSTRFDSLQVYLVSTYAGLNQTVSGTSELLYGQTGTVGHFNWPVPSCLPPDSYNLTFYETFHFDDVLHSAATPIPVSILNDHPTSPCTEGLNALDTQPQPSNPLVQPPFLPGKPPANHITSSIPRPIAATTSAPPSTVTIMSTITTVVTEPSETYTTTILITRTTIQIQNTQGVSGLVPVNGSSATLLSVIFSQWWILVVWVSVAVLGG